MLQQMNEFLEVMQARDEASASNQREHRHWGSGESSSWFGQSKPICLEFLRYDGGEDPSVWFCLAEQFFELHETAETKKVKLASFHLEGDA